MRIPPNAKSVRIDGTTYKSLTHAIVALFRQGRPQQWIATRLNVSRHQVASALAADRDKPAEAPKNTRRERKCLCCSGAFISQWNGERVCKKCKQTEAWRGVTI